MQREVPCGILDVRMQAGCKRAWKDEKILGHRNDVEPERMRSHIWQ